MLSVNSMRFHFAHCPDRNRHTRTSARFAHFKSLRLYTLHFTLFTTYLITYYYLIIIYNYINTISIGRLDFNRHICQREISEKPNDFPLGTTKSPLKWSYMGRKTIEMGGLRRGCAYGDGCACGASYKSADTDLTTSRTVALFPSFVPNFLPSKSPDILIIKVTTAIIRAQTKAISRL